MQLRNSSAVLSSRVNGTEITMTKLPESDPMLADDIERELTECNASLQRLSSVLSSDSIPRELMIDFRDAVNRVRVSAWIAQKSIADREGQPHEYLLAQEWTRVITRLCEKLAEYISCHQSKGLVGTDEMLAAISKLSVTIQIRNPTTPH
jgi:hypothetical protein